MKKRRVYLSGPITNNPNYKEDFEKAENYYKDKGFAVVNPAKLPLDPEDFTQDEFMTVCLVLLRTCGEIALLPGWGESKGARKELYWALHGSRNYKIHTFEVWNE